MADRSESKSVRYIPLFIATTWLTLMLFVLFNLSPADAGEGVCGDGRINCEAWQTGAIYCLDSGIEVLFARADDSRQGQRALFASRETIDSAGIPSGQDNILLVGNADAYTLHRLSDSRIQFTSPGIQPGSLYIHQFYYPACIGAGPVNPAPNTDPIDSPVPQAPTITPIPTSTPIPPIGGISITCGPSNGQFTLNWVSIPAGPSYAYSLNTAPIAGGQAGSIPTGSGSATLSYPGGTGPFDVVNASYTVNGGSPITIPGVTGCP